MEVTDTFTWRHVLYRFYDATGDLLYVGLTNDIGTRFSNHVATKSWWSEVADCRIEFLPSREALEEAEILAIQTEMPRYNQRHNPCARLVEPLPVPQQVVVEPPPERISYYDMEPPIPGARLRDDSWSAWWVTADGRTIILPGPKGWSQDRYDEQERRAAAGLPPDAFLYLPAEWTPVRKRSVA